MILIVDDKSENIFSLQRTLELNNFSVDSATSGEEALKKILKNDEYSLIILDVQMPGMDGFEVAEIISGYSKSKDIPIIFLSAVNTEKRFIAKGYTAGGVDYVTKPVDPDIFLLKVKTLHRLHEQNRELHKMQLHLQQEVEIRRKTEEALHAKVEELQSILEAIPQIAFTLKPDGQLEFTNEYWYLYSNEAGKMPEFHTADTAVLDKWMQAIADGQALISEVRIKNISTGVFRYHLLKMIPIRQKASVVKWVGTFTDIHEQKMANELLEKKINERTEELLLKNNELETSNHELQQFAYVASHDLQEPLRKVQVFSSIIRNKFSQENTELDENLDRIVTSSVRMGNLITDLLEYSRLSIESFYQPANLTEIIHNILPDLELVIAEKKAQIHIGALPEIDAIPGQMRQVFQNLVSNSLKFSKHDAVPEICITSELIAEKSLGAPVVEDGAYCRIIVSDNGIGFNEKYNDKIFTIFQRLHTKDKYEGTGIGLSIVKKIIEKHNGLISVKSAEGLGASFTIILPLRQPEMKSFT